MPGRGRRMRRRGVVAGAAVVQPGGPKMPQQNQQAQSGQASSVSEGKLTLTGLAVTLYDRDRLQRIVAPCRPTSSGC